MALQAIGGVRTLGDIHKPCYLFTILCNLDQSICQLVRHTCECGMPSADRDLIEVKGRAQLMLKRSAGSLVIFTHHMGLWDGDVGHSEVDRVNHSRVRLGHKRFIELLGFLGR